MGKGITMTAKPSTLKYEASEKTVPAESTGKHSGHPEDGAARDTHETETASKTSMPRCWRMLF